MLGKTGEIKPDKPVQLQVKHRDFRQPINVTLKTDAAGVVTLGELAGIERITLTNPNGTTQSWPLLEPDATRYSVLQGIVGETLSLPYLGAAAEPSRDELALLSYHGSTFVKDHFDALKLRDGMLELVGLPAGDYQLLLKSQWRVVYVRDYGRHDRGEAGIGEQPQTGAAASRAGPDRQRECGRQSVASPLTNATKFTRVHILASRYQPAFSAMGVLGQVDAGEPYWMSRPGWPSVYLEGRSIGEEYQYIFDRKYARKYPGNMLDRPSLLLNPWAVRSTETGTQEAAAGDDFAPADAPAPSQMSGDGRPGQVSGGLEDYADLDFLTSSTVVELNLVPEDGQVAFEIDEELSKHWFTIVAVDPESTAYRSTVTPAAVLRSLDLRLKSNLDPAEHFVQKKQVSTLAAGEQFSMNSASAARLQSYTSLAAAFRLMSTLSGNPTLPEFKFVVEWNEKSNDEKQTLYSKFACHELHFFLYYKDREFFDAAVRPYLSNKLHKTFLDQWLLGESLVAWREPWRYQQLNAVEKVLLGQRLAEEQAYTERLLNDQYEIAPLTREEFDRLFSVAIKGTSLDVDSDTRVDFDASRELAEFENDARNAPRGGVAQSGGFMGGGGGFGGRAAAAAPAPASGITACNGEVPVPVDFTVSSASGRLPTCRGSAVSVFDSGVSVAA